MFGWAKRRTRELLTLRGRFVVWSKQARGAETQAAAQLLLRRKLELADLCGAVSACSGCAKSCEGKVGRFDGGLCCSGSAANVFEDVEIAALTLTGTKASDLVASGDDAGCVFRGESGCVLALQHRPSVCVHYVCGELMRELGGKGRARKVADAQDRLRSAMDRFSDLYAQDKEDMDFRDVFGGELASSLPIGEHQVEEPS